MKRNTIGRRFSSLNFRKPFVCHREGYFAEGHADGYFKCSRNPDGTFSRIRLRCLGGQFFDNTLKRCIYVRGRRQLPLHYRFRNHKPYLYSYNRRKRERYLRPFRNKRKRYGFKKWNHHEKSQKNNILRNAKPKKVTTQSFMIPSQSDLKSSSKLKHKKHGNSGYKPSPNVDENLETTYEEVHNNFDENIRDISRDRTEYLDSLPTLFTGEYNTESPTLKKYHTNDQSTNEEPNLFGYVQRKRECQDKCNSPTSSKSDNTSDREDQNAENDSTTVENFKISSNSKTNDDNSDEDSQPEESLYERFPKRRGDVNFKVNYGSKNKARDSNYPSEEDLVIEIPLNGAAHTCNRKNLVINKENDIQSTLGPEIVIKLRQSQQMSTDSSANDLTLQKILEHRMRLSKNSEPETNYGADYNQKEYPNIIFKQRSASKNPNKLLIHLGKKKSRLDSRELTKSPGVTTTTTSTTSVTPITTPSTTHIETTTATLLTTKTTVVTTIASTVTQRTAAKTITSTSSCTTAAKHTTDTCSSSTNVRNLKQVFKHLKDDYISKIHDHNFTTASPGHHNKGHKIGNGHAHPTSFYICSGGNSTNTSKSCNSFYLCHSARSAGKTLKLEVPCPSGMGFDSNLNKCTTNMGKICKSIPSG
ncbi:uncharacterized protein DDB_G0283697-like isoform X2 [Agrilus planipennis]|nr:uncharacterized protein DDB_G0283697-like isoform X2 [Agrilus planipennis]